MWARRSCSTTTVSPSTSSSSRPRSEEHTSELQSPCNLVCRLLLEKKKILVTSSIRVTLPLYGADANVIYPVLYHANSVRPIEHVPQLVRVFRIVLLAPQALSFTLS